MPFPAGELLLNLHGPPQMLTPGKPQSTSPFPGESHCGTFGSFTAKRSMPVRHRGTALRGLLDRTGGEAFGKALLTALFMPSSLSEEGERSPFLCPHHPPQCLAHCNHGHPLSPQPPLPQCCLHLRLRSECLPCVSLSRLLTEDGILARQSAASLLWGRVGSQNPKGGAEWIGVPREELQQLSGGPTGASEGVAAGGPRTHCREWGRPEERGRGGRRWPI